MKMKIKMKKNKGGKQTDQSTSGKKMMVYYKIRVLASINFYKKE